MKIIHLWPMAAFAVATIGALTAPARATFMEQPGCSNSGCPGDIKFYNSDANHGVTSFVGSVGSQSGGPAVTVDTFVNTTTGAGFANIKPSVDGTLDRLLFTPANPLAYSDFSFRGQIERAGFNDALTVTVIGCVVVANTCQKEAPQIIPLMTDKGANADFSRLSVFSTDGETIFSVQVDTAADAFFKEFKQVEFSPAAAPVPEAASFGFLGIGLVSVGLARRRKAMPSA